MKTYVIDRPSAWHSEKELSAAAALSTRIGNEEMPDQVRWIRSYVTRHEGGRLGTVCVYQATGPDAIREHAQRVGMPAENITEVAEAVIVRPDPSYA